jgi:hypothetical protein
MLSASRTNWIAVLISLVAGIDFSLYLLLGVFPSPGRLMLRFGYRSADASAIRVRALACSSETGSLGFCSELLPELRCLCSRLRNSSPAHFTFRWALSH